MTVTKKEKDPEKGVSNIQLKVVCLRLPLNNNKSKDGKSLYH